MLRPRDAALTDKLATYNKLANINQAIIHRFTLYARR